MAHHREPIPDTLLERIGHDHGRHLFVPSHYDFDDPAALAAFIGEHPLGQMVSSDGEQLRATAAALIVAAPDADSAEDAPFELLRHLARRNPHADLVQDGAPAVIVFQGPNGYVSPRWNRENPSLPTWSYLAVQVRGRFEPFTDLDTTRRVLERTIAHMERHAESPWRLDDAPPELVEKLRARGDRQIRYLSGLEVLGPEHADDDLLDDGVHPSGDGYEHMADRFPRKAFG